ncbi:MAG TPA: hypothetical protein ENN14_02210 [Chloroflexi bacterium]|nr:hypothetical protein [Chloroflexota bacterium]
MLLSLLVPRPVLAYLDPGTGSYIIQLLIGAAVGLGFLIKVNWNRIKAFFSKKDSGDASEQE